MSKEPTASLFDRASAAYDQASPQVFAAYGRRLVEFAHLSSGMRVLDVATGKGAALFPAATQVGPHGRVIGIDLSMGMVRATAADIRATGGQPIELCQMDAERLALADASFDRVLCGHSIFFFPSVAFAQPEAESLNQIRFCTVLAEASNIVGGGTAHEFFFGRADGQYPAWYAGCLWRVSQTARYD